MRECGLRYSRFSRVVIAHGASLVRWRTASRRASWDSGGAQGGFAELAVASAALSFSVPESIPEAYGVLVEPFSVGLHAARKAKIAPGDSVLVLGAGSVGLTTVRWAKEMGAKEIVVADPVGGRRELSAQFGATAAVDPSREELGRNHNVVIDCVGKPGLLNSAVAAAAVKGRIVIAGVCAEPDPFLPIAALLKELTVAFAVYYLPEEFRRVSSTHSPRALLIRAP